MTRTSEGAAPLNARHTATAEDEPFPPPRLTDFGGPVVELDPQTPASSALKRVYRALLPGIAANEDGVRDGLQDPYLHDFRVAVRRTRTGLRQFRKVHPKPAAKRFTRDFAWLGDVTGPARDLEVYLVGIEEHTRSRPELGERLQSFVDFLRERQEEEQRRVRQALESDRYRLLRADWNDFLRPSAIPEDGEAMTAVDANRPVLEVAVEGVGAAHRRVVETGSSISGHTPTSKFHRLRLDCKKLRYLLEFFRGLCLEEPAVRLIQSLKRLQDNLGDLNDLSVQFQMTAEFGLTPSGGTPEGEMAELVAFLEEDHRQQLARFPARFAEFTGTRIDRVFRDTTPAVNPDI